jgi:hypothetical protein
LIEIKKTAVHHTKVTLLHQKQGVAKCKKLIRDKITFEKRS